MLHLQHTHQRLAAHSCVRKGSEERAKDTLVEYFFHLEFQMLIRGEEDGGGGGDRTKRDVEDMNELFTSSTNELSDYIKSRFYNFSRVKEI